MYHTYDILEPEENTYKYMIVDNNWSGMSKKPKALNNEVFVGI